MKRFSSVLIFLFFIFSGFAYCDNTSASGDTVVASSDGMVVITARIQVDSAKGVPVPRVDREIYKYASDISFVYSKDKKHGLMIIKVAAENEAAVREILKGRLVTVGDNEKLERDFKGYKKRLDGFKEKRRSK